MFLKEDNDFYRRFSEVYRRFFCFYRRFFIVYQRFFEVYRRFSIYRLASPKQKTLPRKEEFTLKSINQPDHVAALDSVFKNRFRIISRKEIPVNRVDAKAAFLIQHQLVDT